MIEIHLYGSLRRYGEQPRADRPSVLRLSIEGTPTVAQVLQQVGIAPTEVGHVFLNGRLLNTGSTMAPWLGYQTAQARLPTSGDYLETPMHSGDRLGLFPADVPILVI